MNLSVFFTPVFCFYFLTNAANEFPGPGQYRFIVCVALRCVALRCVALRCVALRCVALHCIVTQAFTG